MKDRDLVTAGRRAHPRGGGRRDGGAGDLGSEPITHLARRKSKKKSASRGPAAANGAAPAQRPAARPRAPLRLLLLLRRRDRHVGGAGAARVHQTEQFDAISDYLIPKPLCGRLLTLRAFGHVFLCWPTCIENNKKYARNALISRSASCCSRPPATGAPHRHGEVLSRAAAVTELERESSFLSARRDELHHLCRSCSATCARAAACRRRVARRRASCRRGRRRRRRRRTTSRRCSSPSRRRRRCAAGTSRYGLLPLMDGTQPVARIAAAARRRRVGAARRRRCRRAAGCASSCSSRSRSAPPPPRSTTPRARRRPPGRARRRRAGRPRRRRWCCGCSPPSARPTTVAHRPRRLRGAPRPRRAGRRRALVTAALLTRLLRAVDVVLVVPRR